MYVSFVRGFHALALQNRPWVHQHIHVELPVRLFVRLHSQFNSYGYD